MVPTSEENAALVRRFLTDVVAGRDTDAVDGFFAKDVADHSPVFGNSRGCEAITTLCWRVLAAPDVDIGVDEVVATEEAVAVRATVIGVHRESLMDLAPTGRLFEIACVWFCRIEDGCIAEIHSLPDGLSLMQDSAPSPNCQRTARHLNQPTTHSYDTQ